MRIDLQACLLFTSLSLCLLVTANLQSGNGLYPPGLLPLINRANAHLSSGQFNDAIQTYTEAIDQSPADYLLYYKRATAYFSLSRHAQALDDFDHVLSLTHGSFPNAILMKSKIYLKDGSFSQARAALKAYKGDDRKASNDVLDTVGKCESAAAKAVKARKAGLWNACVESASEALGGASHSVQMRHLRAECALAAGDVASAVADLTRLTHLLPPSTSLQILLFRLSYFLLPAPPPSSSSSAATLQNLKQCLHYDPDSSACLPLHRLAKSFEKDFTQLDKLLEAEDWKAIVALVDKSKSGIAKAKAKAKAKTDLLRRYDEAMQANTARDQLLPDLTFLSSSSSSSRSSSTTNSPTVPLPSPLLASPRRQHLVRALCRAHTRLADSQQQNSMDGGGSGGREWEQMEKWCTTLLGMDGCGEDVDGLVGKGEGLLKREEWEEGVRVLETAWEKVGRGGGDIHNRLQRAQKLLKQSKAKDYYKVLGVPRDVDAKGIKKAFRKAAMTAHPDKGGSEAKMAVVNEAYEVLSDPELRRRYDNGDDPNDHSSGPGGYAHPFAQGFGGSGHPFAQFFQQQGGGGQGQGFKQGGFQFHFSHGG